jgi:hypothetical protein
MTTYLGRDRVDRAQAVLDRHLASGANGLCLVSGPSGPSEVRLGADPQSAGDTTPEATNEASEPQVRSVLHPVLRPKPKPKPKLRYALAYAVMLPWP